MLNPVFSIAHLRDMSEFLHFSTASMLRSSALQYHYSTMLLVKFVSFKRYPVASRHANILYSYRASLQAKSRMDLKRYANLFLFISDILSAPHTDWNIILDVTDFFGTDWPKWLWLFIRQPRRGFCSVSVCWFCQKIQVSSNKRSITTYFLLMQSLQPYYCKIVLG